MSYVKVISEENFGFMTNYKFGSIERDCRALEGKKNQKKKKKK
jgi:hypothetical protein